MVERKIAGHYVLHDQLGSGGMGTVYRGVDSVTGQTVAIKQLKSQISQPENIERFKREGEVLRELNHPNIVKMLDAVVEDDSHYLIMEYVSGGDLATRLSQGKLPLELILRLTIDLADALTRTHKLNIIHRDLKPANLVIGEDGVLRLTDFGVAHVVSKARVTDTDAIVGTIDYLPPETFSGGMFDARGDIWAFGVMLFEMLSGERPFKGSTVMEVVYAITTQPVRDLEALCPEAPVNLIDLIYRMLERDPRTRIPSVRIIGAELEAIQQNREEAPVQARKGRFDTPPLLHPPKHNLPVQITPFVGREHELRQLAQYFTQPDLRLLTIVGQGGMGKTRLMLEVAHRLMGVNDLLDEPPPYYADGLYLIELAPLTTPESIVTAIADTVGYRFQPDERSSRQQLLDFLRPKHIGLLMDNFEHLMDGAGIVADILQTAPHIRITATSRQRLNLSGETVFHLEGMDFPDWETPQDALEYSAVKLFMQGARQANPAFALKTDDLMHIARICKRAIGLPLAIILAASWLEILSIREIADEMSKNIDFLESDAHDMPERHRSMRAVFDYSWNLMSGAEQQVFTMLSVFRGGFTREAVEQVAWANLRILMALVNKSIIRRDIESGRYEIHELTRQYAEARLESSQSVGETRTAHVRYFAAFMKRCEADIKYHRQSEALREIAADFDNVRTAWAHAVDQLDVTAIDQMVEAIYFFCDMRNRHLEGEQLFHQAQKGLAAREEAQARRAWGRVVARRAQMLIQGVGGDEANIGALIAQSLAVARLHADDAEIGLCEILLGTFNSSLLHLQAGLAIFQKLGDRFFMAESLSNYGAYYNWHGQHEIAVEYFQKAETLLREVGDKNGLSWALLASAYTLLSNGRFQEAEANYTESQQLQRDNGSSSGLIWNECGLAQIQCYQGEFNAALSLAEHARHVAADVHVTLGLQISLTTLGFIESIRGDDFEKAQSYCERSYTIDPHNVFTAGWTLRWGLSLVAIHQQNYKDAQRYNHEALNLAQGRTISVLVSIVIEAIIRAYLDNREQAVEWMSMAFQHSVSPVGMLKKWALFNDALRQLETELGTETYNAAWERGKSLDLQKVVQGLLEEFEHAAGS